ncbi:MAG: PIN domain-containing protein [Rhodomicrobium sp.]
MSVLLDTNVISELVKEAPNEQVLIFVSELRSAWISAITTHELDYGVAVLPRGRKRAALEAKLANALMQYSDRVLPVTRAEAQAAALLRAQERRRGRVLHLPDALIAATAIERGLTLATRNVADFDDLGVDVVDPWKG